MAMKWSEAGDVSVDHPRQPWKALGASSTIVHCALEILKGTAESLGSKRPAYALSYGAAKKKFNLEAAADVVERCISGDALDRLVDAILRADKAPIFVIPHPAFDDEDGVGRQEPIGPKPTNALPFAYAAYLAATLGGSVDDEIVQSARVGRTKLNHSLRFLCQPSFQGSVNKTRPYILVDDVVTTSGTMAAISSHIVSKGGTVIASTALSSGSGIDRPFEIAQETLDVLLSSYGAGFEDFWAGTIGHGARCLTEAEARILVEWAKDWHRQGDCRPGDQTLQRLRDRLNQAAAKGS
jgi:hypothetical protein